METPRGAAAVAGAGVGAEIATENVSIWTAC